MRPQVVVEWTKSYLMKFDKAQEESKFSGSKELIRLDSGILQSKAF